MQKITLLLTILIACLGSHCGNAVFNTHFNNAVIDQYFASLNSYWKFEETSGSRLDSIGTNHLTDNNSVASATGVKNSSADFELSSSQYLSASAGHTVTPTDDFAFSLWIKPESTPAANAYLFRTLVGANTSVALFLTSGTGITATIRQANSTNTSISSPTTNFGTTVWHHIVLIGNGTTMKLYVNGVSVGSQTYSGVSASDGLLTIGSETASTLFFDGIIDEFAYWNSNISFTNTAAMDALASALYNSGTGNFLN